MEKKWIRMVKDFEYEAYGKHVIEKDVEQFMTIDSSNQAVITIGHGHIVKVPQEFYVLRDE
jgi:nicotinamide mononucleotide adenylyltransferase